MRFLTDDGKVFNTEEECKEYEAELKKREDLKKEEAELKKRNEELKALSDKYDKILEELKAVGKDLDAYKNKYPEKTTKKKSSDAVHSHPSDKNTSDTVRDYADSFAQMLLDYFG